MSSRAEGISPRSELDANSSAAGPIPSSRGEVEKVSITFAKLLVQIIMDLQFKALHQKREASKDRNASKERETPQKKEKRLKRKRSLERERSLERARSPVKEEGQGGGRKSGSRTGKRRPPRGGRRPERA